MLQSQRSLFNLSNFGFKIHWRQNASLKLLDKFQWKEDPEMIWKWTEKIVCIYIHMYSHVMDKSHKKWIKRLRKENTHQRHIEHQVCYSIQSGRNRDKIWNEWELLGSCRPEQWTSSGVEFSYNAQAWNLAKNSLPVTYYYTQKLWSKHLQ
jgi:hypothetical protein